MGNEVRTLREVNKERILHTVIDNDEEKKQLLMKHCRIHSELTEKGPGSCISQNALGAERIKGKEVEVLQTSPLQFR